MGEMGNEALPGGAIRWSRDDDGVVTLTLDSPDRSANTMDDVYVVSMGAAVDRLEAEREEISGVIVASAKKTFFAGGDLEWLYGLGADQVPEASEYVDRVKAQLRRLETLGRPVVSVIAGAALGGGLEIALATHRRIAVDDPKVKLGLPEVTLGLMPGAGGVVRTTRMFGIVKALTEVLLEGRAFTPAKALKQGLIDETVADAEELIPAAKRWIAANPDAAQPWDRDGFKIPGGTPASPALAATLPAIPANVRKQLNGANYTAPPAIAAAAVEGTQVDFDNASAIETRYFAGLATGQVAKNMIKAFFFDMQAVNGPRGSGDYAAKKAAVLGAGMMGSGIAYACAKAGIDVVLRDVDQAAAERGREHSRKLLDRAIERGRTTREAADALLDRITPSAEIADVEGADLVIEAVFEDPALKAKVFGEVEPRVAADALLGSNTSTLPITGLAEAVSDPERFIGLHFFSPVDRMPLLEIIKGERTGEQTLDRALDFARQIGKTPIVVNDSPGFFTSRVIKARLSEGLAMVGEGVAPASIEHASLKAGYPASLLQLADELNLELLARIRDAAKAEAEAAGGTWEPHPSEAVIDRMIELGRSGRAAGAGFYDYEDGKRQGLWPGLAEEFGVGGAPDFARDLGAAAALLADLRDRLLFVEALEAVRCREEGVIESVADANVGSILGIGFPGWTGGALQFVDAQDGGPSGFVARLEELAAAHGPRFAPTEGLRKLAAGGGNYRDSEPGAIGSRTTSG